MHLEEQYDRIYKYLYFRLHDRHAAEDMTQEAFLRFLRSRTYRDENRQLQYLYTIARNLCSQYYRDKVISYSLDEETERVLPIPAGTQNDKPAPPGNEPWGIPDRPVAVYREMDMDIFRPSAVIHYMDLLQTSRELSVCPDAVSCSGDPFGNKEVFSLENGRTRACGQIFLKKCHACEAVPGRHCKYSRTSYHHFDHPAIFFLFPDSGIPVHDGTLSDCFVVRVGL